VPLPAAAKPRNPFDTAERPSRSLFDRIEAPANAGRSRSESPRRNARRSDVRRPAPEGIDRYIPGEGGESRRRSPMPRRGEGRRGSDRGGPARRPGERRRRSPGKDTDGHSIVQGRPRKTQEELDAEMEDYWGSKEDAQKQSGTTANTQETAGTTTASGATTADIDIDMIE
jgi:THO complex subunit 4